MRRKSNKSVTWNLIVLLYYISGFGDLILVLGFEEEKRENWRVKSS